MSDEKNVLFCDFADVERSQISQKAHAVFFYYFGRLETFLNWSMRVRDPVIAWNMLEKFLNFNDHRDKIIGQSDTHLRTCA